MPDNAHEASLGMLSQAIATHMGLHFPPDRWRDLERAIAKALPALGFRDVQECLRKLLEGPLTSSQIEILASHLTIGETHFFRHEKVFEILEERILPELIATRRGTERRLRIWSAGCATGEEPYSIAMMIRKVLYDLPSWDVTILGTDINQDFLRKARRGVYSQWSFRTVPQGIKEKFFSQNGEGLEVLETVKAMVTLASLNLARDIYPHISTDTHAMDMIFCRNVLMYFTPEKQQEVVEALYRCLVDGGWLIVSPAEASVVLHPHLVTTNYPGAVMYRKDPSYRGNTNLFAFAFANSSFDPPSDVAPKWDPAVANPFFPDMDAPDQTTEIVEVFHRFEPLPELMFPEEPEPSLDQDSDLAAGMPTPLAEWFAQPPVAAEPGITPYAEATALYEQGLYAAAIDKLFQQLEHDKSHGVTSGTAMALLARSYANRGMLDQALEWAEKTIAIDKLNSDYHYLYGTILQEQGRLDEAIVSLRRAVFLEPNFVVAHFALGNIARQKGREKDADRHYRIALKILSDYDEQAPVPASEGMTAGRLIHMILAMTSKEIPHEK